MGIRDKPTAARGADDKARPPRLLDAGLSRFEPDPLAAIAEAEQRLPKFLPRRVKIKSTGRNRAVEIL
jgi:hypothetical protein